MLQAAVSARAIKSKGAANMSKINSYNACIYARLSRDDGDKLESDSIINQKAIIRDFLSKHPEIHAVSEKTDDGYSGVNFDRPAFQEMMEDIRSGKINCVVVKDLSRFGRNYIEAGNYIERVFPFLGVRFIAINDNYDSLDRNQSDSLIIPFKNLINDAYPVYMSESEEELYSDMAEDLFLPLKGGEVTAANAAALSGKLMQMANGAVYSDDGNEIQIHDQKLDALEDLIEAANGKPVMVAYWFKHDLTRIMRRLSERKIPFEKLDSEESIRKWNREELPVALIHPASAGHGLNLQSGGNMLIWFGLTWSLELYQQTVARLWRQGQAAETVVVQHIITAGTIDEQVMKALESKDRTQSALINAVKAEVRRSARRRKSE